MTFTPCFPAVSPSANEQLELLERILDGKRRRRKRKAGTRGDSEPEPEQEPEPDPQQELMSVSAPEKMHVPARELTVSEVGT